jgi:hypothetical protein
LNRTPFSTATVAAIAQAARQFTERLTALEDERTALDTEAAGIRRILAILQEGTPINTAAMKAAAMPSRRVGAALQAEAEGFPAPAPAVAPLSAWARRKAREAEIAAGAPRRAGGRPPKKTRRPATRKGRAATKTPREKNDRTLQSIFVSLLANHGAPMSTDELAEGAKAEGYRSVSQNFRQVGYMLLTKRPKVFRKNAAGNWTLITKGAANG